MEQQQAYRCANKDCGEILDIHEGYDNGNGEIICYDCFHKKNNSNPSKKK